MSATARPNPNAPVIARDRTMSVAFRRWTRDVTTALPITGTGSPEGVIDAPLYTLYIDVNGTTGSIEYRKMTRDIGGDPKKGWLLL